ncbi:hypothetical protein BK026_18495 [Alteromonas sp. V450]|uniref:P-loop ATPase, Sll1717 family n=1 Tax=Alteromonas sp. V450 TaxID=1912139 RepID=UPI000918A239|nr:hypothetical protein [Alteromonas sp. V450]OJF70599.1 hypothetical protein BK026_18495 [Alteromonas sp. V450]
MKNRPNIYWGPIDAKDESDGPFLEKFVQCSSYKEIIDSYKPLISGEKGSGKSAFKRHLVATHKKNNDVVTEISFDDIEYVSVIENLNYLIEYTQAKSLSVLSHYWQFVIFIYAMKTAMSVEKTHLTKEKNLIQEYLTDSGFAEMGIVSIMSLLTFNAIKKIEQVTNPADKRDLERLGLPTALSAQVHDSLKSYPLFDPKFVQAKNAFFRYLNDGGRKVIITIDDFDEIKAKSTDDRLSIQSIFDSLISAIYVISLTHELRDAFRVYCFIPHDRLIEADLRDYDKIEYKHEAIIWDYAGIKKLLGKRIAFSTGGKKFDEVWQSLFPAVIPNDCYNIQESSFEYLLRHTQYRPRQILRTLEALETEARKNDFDANKFRQVIHRLAKKNVDAFIKEYSIDHPNLKRFFHRFKNFSNVCEYTSFRQKVEKIISDLGSYVSLDDKIDQLYNMGFFGVLKELKGHDIKDTAATAYLPPTRYRGQRYLCKFYYHHPDESISGALQGEDVIVIHPMFFDYCEQDHHSTAIVG